MKVKIGAGVTFDTVSPGELDKAMSDLKSWHVELIKGGRPILFDAQGVIANNALTIGGSSASPSSGRVGPEAGYVWAIRRLAQTGLANATDPTSIFIGDNEPSRLVFPNLTGVAGATGYKSFNGGEFILLPTQKVLVASTGAIGSAGTVTISGAAWELPIGLLWQLV
jgi:hypothetical protein